MTVLIAGGGISGLALALSCHQANIPFQVFEATPMLNPLGVGINLQPSAVRELYALGVQDQLDDVGIQTRDFGMYTKRGLHIWTEPRGLHAGYHWPQYSVHRGKFHMMLYNEVLRRAGPDAVRTGWKATGFDTQDDRVILHLLDGQMHTQSVEGYVLIGADGIHSALRKQIAPFEGAPCWEGAVLYRGTTLAKAPLSGASMALIGHASRRFVTYPISQADPETGLSTINWIAELNFGTDTAFDKGNYAQNVPLEKFAHHFKDFKFDWLDCPSLIAGAEEVFEYPMVDRDPLDRWTHGRMTLMGDAAHAAYPVGSNGAGAGIIDARKLVAAFLKHGLSTTALQTFEDEMRPLTNRMVLTNRGAGPDEILNTVEDRCDGYFDHIHDVISEEEMAQHAAFYKRIAGTGISDTNERPDIVPEGAQFTQQSL
ncbi:flavin-dependent oxidoreductase [Ascidiaceihabitans sp.]|uniref:flavin-dependent oxidoreductase n=1 Tax=Ascidiaceihabitans sp. TaxID=1872644 RepID=UPI00329A22DB